MRGLSGQDLPTDRPVELDKLLVDRDGGAHPSGFDPLLQGGEEGGVVVIRDGRKIGGYAPVYQRRDTSS